MQVQPSDQQETSRDIHISLMGKGGVGKSLSASVLAQYLKHHGQSVKCIDADPVNKTLCQYQALGARPLHLLRDGVIDSRAFDELLEELLTQNGPFVVDNGASTFVPLWHYILENEVMEVFRRAGKRLLIHTVLTGGQALGDTLNGFAQIAETTPDDDAIVIWINEFFGRVEFEGKKFDQMAAYLENKSKICGVVVIPRRNHDTFGRDVEGVIAQKLTFDDAISNGRFSLMSKQRLKVVQRDLFEQLDRLGFCACGISDD